MKQIENIKICLILKYLNGRFKPISSHYYNYMWMDLTNAIKRQKFSD